MSIRVWLYTGLMLLALAAGACAKPPAADQAKADGGKDAGKGGKGGPQPVTVLTAAVQQRAYAPAIVLQGEIRAAQQATLAAEVAGKVVAIAQRVGEKHGRGAGALISIDPASYDTAITMALADLAEAQQALKRLQNGPRQQEIAAQEAAVAAAQAKYDQAQDNLGRQQELYDQGAIAETALVDARTAAQTAQAALDAAQQVLDALRQGSRSEDIGAAQARVDQARSSLAAARLQRRALRWPRRLMPWSRRCSLKSGSMSAPVRPCARSWPTNRRKRGSTCRRTRPRRSSREPPWSCASSRCLRS